MEMNIDLEGFFRDASEDFKRTIESDVASAVASASKHVKLIKRKKCTSKKSKTPSKVKTRPRRSKSKSSNKMPKRSELKSSNVEKIQKKVMIKYHPDTEDTDKVIIDLDLTTKDLIEQFEDFINNNNYFDEPSPKTSSSGSKLKSCKPHDANIKGQFSSHSKPREWLKKESEFQERMAMTLSTWDEDMSNFPELQSETIAGVTMISGELHFIVDWGGDRWMVKSEEAYKRIPMTCLKYYESLLVWNTK